MQKSWPVVFSQLESTALSNPSAVSDRVRRRLLDFPEPEVQRANIAVDNGRISRIPPAAVVAAGT
ncbi:hypothetical protein BO70DRAFT_366640 [Aspergillus heteromorphus CBS 117.55]|uniref:Uncharacterized protein n=1 Tax=Aspergillus heteromorphus CBS 117.55 TaxID=1448321 RepID=A0A317UXH0_9EURO|nr:uncharacterized protein BO70DRAFT_366640 [Aspergillus heteromorphus CBS 117.55]PWY66029.1 hypothetical protein BO70DRAFT_366640 [Aspergillus heteromorphus CBS 117.55]